MNQNQNPLNPVMPAPGMPSGQVPPTAPMPPLAPMTPQVHTMPERFRSSGTGGGGPKGSSTTKKLLITLIVVVVVAGLGVVGLFLFNKFVKTNTNTENTNVAQNINTNSSGNTNTLTNTLTNTAVNSSLNTNTVTENTNALTNTSANTNLNTNSVNTNAAVNTNTTTNTNTSVSSAPLPSSKDTDADGLTDVEEAVYTTDSNNPDSDGDTFLDGMKVQADGSVLGELANLYNPKGAGGLETATIVKRIQNSANTFGLLIPATWTTNESSSILVITPTAQTGEFFQVRVYDNASAQTPAAWYQANVPQGGTATSAAINGLETMRTADQSSVYFFKGAKVYGLSYTTTGLTQANYWATMMMMMKSFKLVAS